jgi:hypothetical protein
MKRVYMLAALAIILLGSMTAVAVDAADRFKGGMYDGYVKQDVTNLGIPAIRPKGTMVSFM